MRLALVCFSLCLGMTSMFAMGQLMLTVNTEKELSGSFYYENVTGDLDVEIFFKSSIEKSGIVSRTELSIAQLDMQTELVKLVIPLDLLYERKIDNLETMVQTAGGIAYRLLMEQTNSSVMLYDAAEMYHDLVATLYEEMTTEQVELNQLHYGLMYHGSVMTAAYKVSMGAEELDDICRPSLKYEFGTQYFICMQDLEFITMQSMTKEEMFLEEEFENEGEGDLEEGEEGEEGEEEEVDGKEDMLENEMSEEDYKRNRDRDALLQRKLEEFERKSLNEKEKKDRIYLTQPSRVTKLRNRKAPVYRPVSESKRGPSRAIFWGCCSSQQGLCTEESEECFTLDCICQCCDKYFCGKKCINTRNIDCSTSAYNPPEMLNAGARFDSRYDTYPRQQCF